MKSYIYKSITILTLIILTSRARAESIFPQSEWESPPLPHTIVSAASGDVNGDGQSDIVFSTSQGVFLTTATTPADSKKIIESHGLEEFHRVHAGGFRHDGGADILVNGFIQNQAFSELWQWHQGKWQSVQRFPAIVMPRYWHGATVLFEQKLRGRGAFAEDITALQWNGKKFVATPDHVPLNRGVGPANLNLFQVVGMGDKMALILPSGHIAVVDAQGKTLWRSGVKYGGSVDHLNYASKDPLGLQTESVLALMPRMMYDNITNRIYVIKNAGILSQTAQYFVLSWTAGGLQEGFVSRRFDGTIVDLNTADGLLLSLWAGKNFLSDVTATPKSIMTKVAAPSF